MEGLLSINPVLMTTAQRQQALRDLTRLENRVHAAKLRVLAASSDIGIETGARSTAHWLAVQAREQIGTTLMQERVAVAVEERWTRVGSAMTAGSVNLAQARVITEALDALPVDVDPELRDKGEAYLVTEAAHFGPRELKRLGSKLLEVIAPDIADQAEYQRLLAEERRARSATKLTFLPRGDGTTDLHARLPDHVANRLRTYLEAHTSPRRNPLGDVDHLPMPRRRGEAFCALLENLPAKGLPQHGGTATSVMVMIGWEEMRGGLGTAATSTGDTLTAEQARRLACQADILPVVLNGRGEILDLGRARRLFSPAQRKAMVIRDRGCTADGCDIPAAWCEAHHHKKPWSKGGKTDLADGKLLCSFHHHRAHDPGWETHHHANGSTSFHRRT
jgi:hypothetical protein